jgi:WD40 repeat protein
LLKEAGLTPRMWISIGGRFKSRSLHPEDGPACAESENEFTFFNCVLCTDAGCVEGRATRPESVVPWDYVDCPPAGLCLRSNARWERGGGGADGTSRLLLKQSRDIRSWFSSALQCPVLPRLDGHADYVRAAAVSPTSAETWATGAYDHVVKLWVSRDGCSGGPR